MTLGPTPAQMAEFDQAFAESQDALRGLIGAYRAGRKYDEAAGISVEMSVMSLATILYDQWDCPNLIGALVVAIVELAKRTDG